MIAEIGVALRGRAVSCTGLAREALRRAERHSDLNAFITLLPEQAIARAEQLDDELSMGEYRGPLHGIPIVLKDLVCTKGVRTTAGSPIFANYVPNETADVAMRLENAGAVVIGKTGLHELAYGITSTNPHFGAIRNPWDTERIPGGSSGGTGAAVAVGICPAGIGTDTGGSIRIPASFCGVVGFKPTYGVVSTRGVLPLGFSLDHVGPIAVNVRDAALTMAACVDKTQAGEYSIPSQPSMKGIRIGRPGQFYFEKLEPGVRDAIEGVFRTAQGLGATVATVNVPDIDAFNTVALTILLGEAAAALEPHLERRGDFGPDVRLLLDQGRLLPASKYVNAQRLRRVFCKQFAAVWESCDLLLLPTTPTTAPKIGQSTVSLGGGEEDVRLLTTRCVRAINALGWPALSMPCGISEGLPASVQIVGPPFSDGAVLRAGAVLEDGLGTFPCKRFENYL